MQYISTAINARTCSHYAAFTKISTGEQNLKLGGSKEQESSPLLRSAARTPRKAGHTETASSHSRSCSTAGDLCRIAPPSPLLFSLSLSLAFSFAFGADEIFPLEHAEICTNKSREIPVGFFGRALLLFLSTGDECVDLRAEQRRLDGAKYCCFYDKNNGDRGEELMRSLNFFSPFYLA